MFQGIADSVPAKRVGRPEDIAQTVLYLIANDYTTGSTLYVEGGATLRYRRFDKILPDLLPPPFPIPHLLRQGSKRLFQMRVSKALDGDSLFISLT
jgi:hypothetical protein